MLVQHLVVDGSIDARLAQVLVGKQRVLDKALDNVIVNEVSIEDIALTVQDVEKAITVKTKKQPKPLSAKTVKSLQECVQRLCEACDGALELDGSGYNKIDSGFGHSLANQAEWTPAQQHAAKIMIKKYKNQLTGLGMSKQFNIVFG